MSAGTRTPSFHLLRALDCVFAQMGGDKEPLTELANDVALPPEAGVSPPPKVETQADLQAAYQWLLRERQRLENYTANQLTRLQNEHADMVKRYYYNEQSLIHQNQQLANKEDFLTRQSRGLQEQAQQLAEREAALAAQREQLCRAHSEIASLQEVSAGARRDADLQHSFLETLRAETAALQQDRQRARADLEEMELRLQQQRTARVREEELLAARQTQLEQRFRTLEQAEEAVQRRLAELDDLEARLRQEIEEQEEQLVAERHALAAQVARLRPPVHAVACGLAEDRKKVQGTFLDDE